MLLALVVRLGVVWEFGNEPEADALEYHSLAVNYLSGFGHTLESGELTSHLAPLYPIFLAGIYSLVGTDPICALYVQAVMHTLLVLPIFALAFRISGSPTVGFLSATAFALHTSFEIVAAHMSENLMVLLVVGFLWSAYEMGCAVDGRGYALIAGVFAGLLGLTNPAWSLFGLWVLAFGLCFQAGRMRWQRLTILALTSLLLVVPWQVRNHLVADHAQQEHLRETILAAYYPALVGTWWWPVTDMEELEQERANGKAFMRSHQDQQVLWDQLKKSLVTAPLGMVKLATSRILILWASPPVGSSVLGSFAHWLKWAALLSQYIFVTMAVGMLLYASVRRPELFSFWAMAMYMTLLYAALHSIRRYGYPLVPELCVFASWGVFWLWEKARRYHLSAIKEDESGR